jgi:hypothetical protein
MAVRCWFGRVSLHNIDRDLPLPGDAWSHAKRTPHPPESSAADKTQRRAVLAVRSERAFGRPSRRVRREPARSHQPRGRVFPAKAASRRGRIALSLPPPSVPKVYSFPSSYRPPRLHCSVDRYKRPVPRCFLRLLAATAPCKRRHTHTIGRAR